MEERVDEQAAQGRTSCKPWKGFRTQPAPGTAEEQDRACPHPTCTPAVGTERSAGDQERPGRDCIATCSPGQVAQAPPWESLGSQPGSATYLLWDCLQVTYPLCTSVSSSEK